MLSAGINKLDLTEYSGTGVPLGLSPSGIDVTLGNLPVHSQVCVGGLFGRAIRQNHLPLAFIQTGKGMRVDWGIIGSCPVAGQVTANILG